MPKEINENIANKLLDLIVKSAGLKKVPSVLTILFKKDPVLKAKFIELQKNVDEIEKIASKLRKEDPVFRDAEQEFLKKLRS